MLGNSDLNEWMHIRQFKLNLLYDYVTKFKGAGVELNSASITKHTNNNTFWSCFKTIMFDSQNLDPFLKILSNAFFWPKNYDKDFVNLTKILTLLNSFKDL